jgi:hypothetical protein
MGFLSKKESEEKKIRARIVLEILGRPKEHIVEVMNQIGDKIGQEKGIKLIDKTTNEAKIFEQKDEKGNVIPMREGEQELYSTFSEIEFEAGNIMDLLAICFNYMPANVEIIEPENFVLKNIDFNSLINELIRRLHHYDSIAKTAMMHNQILAKQIEAIKQNVDSKTLSQKLEQIANPKIQEKKEETKPEEKQIKKSKKKKKN